MTRDWTWVTVEVAMAAHAEQLAEHGGGEGVRDAGLLESAMARAQNLTAYRAISSGAASPRGSEIAATRGIEPDAADLAAAYAYGIARNHPFVDGNKRTAAVVSETFLLLNGHGLGASDAELVVAFLALAAGGLSEEEMADWFRGHLRAG